MKGLQARDPKRLAIYFTKHSSPNMDGAKEYQHNVPELWREPGKGRVRRRQLLTQGGLNGGIALANNGPEFASQLARALGQWHGHEQG